MTAETQPKTFHIYLADEPHHKYYYTDEEDLTCKEWEKKLKKG